MRLEDYLAATKFRPEFEPSESQTFVKLVGAPIKSLLPILNDLELVTLRCEDFISETVSLGQTRHLIYNLDFHRRGMLFNIIANLENGDAAGHAFVANLIGRKLLATGNLSSAAIFCEIYEAMTGEVERATSGYPSQSGQQDQAALLTFSQVGFVLAHEAAHISISKGDWGESYKAFAIARSLIEMSLDPVLMDEFSEMLSAIYELREFFDLPVEKNVEAEMAYWRDTVLSSSPILEELTCDHFASVFVAKSLAPEIGLDNHVATRSAFSVLAYLRLISLCSLVARFFSGEGVGVHKNVILPSLIRHHYAALVLDGYDGLKTEQEKKNERKKYQTRFFEKLFTMALMRPEHHDEWTFYLEKFSRPLPGSTEFTQITDHLISRLSLARLAKAIQPSTSAAEV